MSVSVALTSKCFIALSIFHQILQHFSQKKEFYFVRDLLVMALHYKQNRTYSKNKRRHYSEVTGNKEVLLKIVRVCPIIALL